MHLGINIYLVYQVHRRVLLCQLLPALSVAHLVISQYFFTTATSFALFDFESNT